MRNDYANANFSSWYQSITELLSKLVFHSKEVKEKHCGSLYVIVIVSCFPIMSIRFEDRLDSISNYIPWKVRIIVILKYWKTWNFSNSKMIKPTNKGELEEFEGHEARAQRVILDGVKVLSFI